MTTQTQHSVFGRAPQLDTRTHTHTQARVLINDSQTMGFNGNNCILIVIALIVGVQDFHIQGPSPL